MDSRFCYQCLFLALSTEIKPNNFLKAPRRGAFKKLLSLVLMRQAIR